MKFSVFASGNGTNLQAIIDAVKTGEIKAELGLVFSDNKKSLALKRAEEAGIKTLCLEYRNYTNKQSFDRDIVIALKEHEIDFVVLAGYMRLLTPYFVEQFPRRIINIHPSLLPSFKGIQGIKDAFTYGVKTTGVTVHFVDEKMDHGPIILQESLKILSNDTLESIEEKIHKIEHRIYPKAVQLFVEGRLRIKGRKVIVLDEPQFF
ncbi:MAG: phosphoribosylglycinamide formyltransferase [Candidatus Omnitrophica bacterium]|nr:phosphoribosylglycinamide formyltransferase [Candidatus Omnitrophota bacterium]